MSQIQASGNPDIVMNLDECRGLFRNEQAFDEFSSRFASALAYDLRPIFLHGHMIGLTLSPEGAKDVLYDRLLKRIKERPGLLRELTDRISSDDIVE